MELNSRVFVTGANSLLATNTIVELLSQGFKVLGLLRNIEKYIGPKHKNLSLIEGDILNDYDLDKALIDCQYAIHIASLTDQNRLNYSDYEVVNVFGAKKVITACVRNNIKKIVYISTANVFGYGNLTNLGNEEMSIKKPFVSSYYAQSKFQAQKEILNYSDVIETIIVNPTFMIGPYDAKPSSGKIIVMGMKNKVVFCPPGGKNFVSVTDVSRGVIKALINGKNKEAYILANENLTYKEFFIKLRKQVQNKFLIIQLPKTLLLTLGYFGNILRSFGIQTDISNTNMKILCVNNYYSNEKSVNKLEMQYEPIDMSVSKALKWFDNFSLINKAK